MLSHSQLSDSEDQEYGTSGEEVMPVVRRRAYKHKPPARVRGVRVRPIRRDSYDHDEDDAEREYDDYDDEQYGDELYDSEDEGEEIDQENNYSCDDEEDSEGYPEQENCRSPKASQ